MFRLTDTQQVRVGFSAQSGAGNPAPVENVRLQSSDESVVTVSSLGDGSFLVQSTGKVGTAQLNAEADARIGDGEKLLLGTETIEVVAGEAVVMSLNFGAPEEKPAPVPNPEPTPEPTPA